MSDKSTSFTPGPWHPGHLGSDGNCQCANVVDEGYAGGICTIHVGNGLPIGEGGNDAPPRDQAIANMHLIAAAPAMYEALTKCLEYLEGGNPLGVAGGHRNSYLREVARAALSAASPSDGKGG